MASGGSPDYKALFLQERERTRQTTFGEFIRACHGLFFRPLSVETPSRSTMGTIPPPTREYCPTRLREWTGFPNVQQDIHNLVCRFLQPEGAPVPQLFPSRHGLEEVSR